MPPRTRKPADDAAPDTALTAETAPPVAPMPEVPQICRICFPAGWPDVATAVGCEHGSWQRGALS